MKIFLSSYENEITSVLKIKTVDAVNPSFIKCNDFFQCKISSNGIVAFIEEGVLKKKQRIILDIASSSVENIEYDDKKKSRICIKWKDRNGRLLKSTIEGDILNLVEVLTGKQD